MSTTLRRFSLSLALTLLFWTGQGGPAWAGAGVWAPVGPGASSSSGLASVTVHPASPGTVWVGMPAGGLFRSSDRGVNWRWTGGPFISQYGPGVSAIAADPSLPGALWVATRTGVFRTEDSGAHWAQVTDQAYTDALGEESPQAVLAVPGALHVVTGLRLLTSTDDGRTWQILYDTSGSSSILRFAAHPAKPRNLYLVLSTAAPNLLQSVDGGQTWATVTSCPSAVEEIALAPGAVYVGVAGDAAGLLRSTDLGQTWRPLLGGKRSHPFHVSAVAVDPRAPRTLYVPGSFAGTTPDSGLWVSRNAGGAWTKAGPLALSGFQVDSGGGVLYGYTLGTRDGLQRSLNGGATWSTVLLPPSTESEAAQIDFRPGDPTRAALAVGFTLYRSVNGGTSWKLANAPWGISDVDLDPANPNRLIAINSSNVYLSQDAGATWKSVGARDLWYLEMLVRADAQTLLAAGAGIYRSGDNGQTWKTVLQGFPTDPDTGRWTQKLAVDPNHPATLYALTFSAAVELPHGPLSDWPSFLWKSTDSGRTWKKITRNLRAFAVDAVTSRLYGVRDRQILASDDEGKTWKPAGQMPNQADDLVVDPTDPNTLYTTPFLWQSRDRGATWTLINDQWAPATLTFDPRNPRILYGANRWSVFQITVPE